MRNLNLFKTIILINGIFLFSFLNSTLLAQTGLNCGTCHSDDHDLWITSHHSNTQDDVALELAEEWTGLPPDSVIFGQEAENCIACHSPLAVTANEGMSEVEALNYFFSTDSNGNFADTTSSKNTEEWPHIWCETCHQVPENHWSGPRPEIAIFNSTTAQYDSVGNTSALCGQCHGSLRYQDTDHLRYDAWKMSTHGHRGQDDVAAELSEEFAGSTPEDVAAEENCVACHSPTSVLENGGMTESEALDYFFTTNSGVFTAETTPQNSTEWPDVACTACHNPMHPDSLLYFNSTTKEYETMENPQELCGQCHGNLRFPDTDHLSYNIESGTGGIGVPDSVTMPGIQCVDCHMYAADVDGSNSSMFGGHSWAVIVDEGNGNMTASCTACHQSIGAEKAMNLIEFWQNEFAKQDSIAAMKVARADSILEGSTDSLKLSYLEEAVHNLEFAESDESGGVHNHNYTMSLLNDAIAKSDYIITGIEHTPVPVVADFVLYQNYPNPFNSVTTIPFAIAKSGRYTLKLYNVIGQQVMTILDKNFQPKKYRIRLDADKLSSGIYYYELKGKGRREIKKLMLIK
ncbi:MAG TPA: ammonia-forming cytochrome c nitrite reductase subunit c552 [Caldithrix abyssi]|uniref:Ammonia-forming cytochrome c nitrite reductase subunit c552 n=1 Tax=Caldithrix abyssi TaxID=187145 RepID=A0A7V4U0G3_CALAY|nr:ammonia-forming cytochrome c nitrite reductase subunit c552 [Caldithrix abyssi]